jgi:bifunctional non-homologous end joining protein LigD
MVMDGEHGIIKKEGSKIVAANKQGLEKSLPRSVEEAIQSLSYDVTLDGELIGGRFYVFDILQDQDTDCRSFTYKTRYERLRKIFPDYQLGSLHLVPAVWSTSAKSAMFTKLKAEDREGIVFKRMDTPWSEGRPEVGGNMIKCKFWASLSAIVSEEETGKSSFVSYVLDAKTGERVDLGRCSALGKVMPKAGDVVELKYLYCHKGGKLIQQSLLGIRDDVSPDECTTKQIKFKGKDNNG